jgi:hypothetical protein
VVNGFVGESGRSFRRTVISPGSGGEKVSLGTRGRGVVLPRTLRVGLWPINWSSLLSRSCSLSDATDEGTTSS